MISAIRKAFGGSKTYHGLPVFGGDIRAPVVSPYAKRLAISRITTLSLMFKTASIGLLIMAVALTLYALTVVSESVHIADGSRFGCVITAIEDMPRGGPEAGQ